MQMFSRGICVGQNVKVVINCSGQLIPQHRKQSTLRKNPFYGTKVTDPAINTTDEFVTAYSWSETSWVCMDCKKQECSNDQKERLIYREAQKSRS